MCYTVSHYWWPSMFFYVFLLSTLFSTLLSTLLSPHCSLHQTRIMTTRLSRWYYACTPLRMSPPPSLAWCPCCFGSLFGSSALSNGIWAPSWVLVSRSWCICGKKSDACGAQLHRVFFFFFFASHSLIYWSPSICFGSLQQVHRWFDHPSTVFCHVASRH